MNKYKVLILTDHKRHSSENSLYDLSVKMLSHSRTAGIDIASRENRLNNDFFTCDSNAEIWATSIDKNFSYNSEDHPLSKNYHPVECKEYDLIWLRLPPPLSKDFLYFIAKIFPDAVVINHPISILETGSKEFLLNFPKVSPPMKLCKSIAEINEFRKLHPIVLKPLNEYGGKGILKIENELVSSGVNKRSFMEFAEDYKSNPIDYLAVKFLKNVTKGDKRIVVVNGEILGASLRLPAENSWLCNVSMGGTSNRAEVEPEEVEIIKEISPRLTNLGIVMYGVDTLVDDDGKRVLSEINTTSIGGLPQIAKIRNEPLVERAIDLIWNYYLDKTKRNG